MYKSQSTVASITGMSAARQSPSEVRLKDDPAIIEIDGALLEGGGQSKLRFLSQIVDTL